jgi:cell division protease FtsH
VIVDSGTPKSELEPTPWRVEGVAPPRRRRRLLGGWRPKPWFWLVALALLVGNWVISSRLDGAPEPTPVPYTLFRAEVERGNVVRVNSRRDVIQGRFRTPVRTTRATAPARDFETVRPSFATDDRLLDLLIAHDVSVEARPFIYERPLWLTIIVGFGPALLLVGVLVWVARRTRTGGPSGLGRSRARRYDASHQRTTFADVAGIDEAEQDLTEVVEFLKDPDRFRKLGAAIPKGVLLSGPPGTGKTLLARAVAGEADVPFFFVSASEFVEMVVGVGASRVRDLFQQAKKVAPAIVFIDELDAIGRSRSGEGGGVQNNDEREQALNQILTEMDGFSVSQGVIVLAATNRPELLDKALLRPGRFDRHVIVNAPDQAGRRRILEVHTRDVPLARGVDLGDIAGATPGMAGASLRNLVNEAAILAARRHRERVTREDFADAMEKIVLGAERNITISQVERERTAYHEAGHALLGMLEPGADPVRKVSIVPRGASLGVTFQSAAEDRYGYDEDYLRGRIAGALGGRAAEQLVFGRWTTGAEGDLEQVSAIARRMVGRWGMSEAIGPMSVLPPDDEGPLAHGAVAESTRQLIDTEARRIVEECYAHAVRRLTEHRAQLESLAQALLERETLDEVDAYAAAGFDRPPASQNGASPVVSAFRRMAFGHDGG